MASFIDLDAAADDARFVVDVTAPLAADQTATVVTEAAARLGVPAATMQKLLGNRIGPVTKPVKASTAERVASILTRVGVEVAVREAEPEPEGVQTPPVPMRPDPESTHADGDAPDVNRPLEAETVAPDAALNDAASNPPKEADEDERDTRTEGPAEGRMPAENPPPQRTFEVSPTQPEPVTDNTEPSELGAAVGPAPPGRTTGRHPKRTIKTTTLVHGTHPWWNLCAWRTIRPRHPPLRTTRLIPPAIPDRQRTR